MEDLLRAHPKEGGGTQTATIEQVSLSSLPTSHSWTALDYYRRTGCQWQTATSNRGTRT